MGYTHYFYRPVELDQEKFSAAVKDFNTILPLFEPDNIALADGPGEGKPIVTDTVIQFNGVEEHAHEWFEITRVYSERDLHPDEPLKFGFCKTAQKPYDLAVMSCLIIFKHHFGDQFRVSSDGEMVDWAPAVKLVREHLKYEEDWTFRDDGLVDRKTAAA